jgi:hypothetical protein
MEYTIVSAPNLDDFIRLVNEKMDEGWELSGAAAITVTGATVTYSRELTRAKKGTAKK